MHHLNKLLFFFLLLFFCWSCSNRITSSNFPAGIIPPNGVKINPSLYCDETEVSNIAWLEYMFWTEKVYGVNSDEYLSTLPDTTVWYEQDSCLHRYANVYLRHLFYMDYPVVGLSQEQAIGYSKWRADRVFENLLIGIGNISVETEQSKENHFSIERYYNGTMKSKLLGEKVSYYPHYSLPTLNERQLILSYSDSLNAYHLERCKTKYCKACKKDIKLQVGIVPCDSSIFLVEPIAPNRSGCSVVLYNLRGNVSEWGIDSSLTFGGGWKDDKNSLSSQDSMYVDTPKAWVGFRNVCQWKYRKQ